MSCASCGPDAPTETTLVGQGKVRRCIICGMEQSKTDGAVATAVRTHGDDAPQPPKLEAAQVQVPVAQPQPQAPTAAVRGAAHPSRVLTSGGIVKAAKAELRQKRTRIKALQRELKTLEREANELARLLDAASGKQKPRSVVRELKRSG